MLTRSLARQALAIRAGSLSPAAVEATKNRMLDALGVALAGLRYPESEAAAALAREVGGAEEATLLGAGRRVPVLAAALANGVAAHILTFDDFDGEGLIHPACSIVPGALAVAEQVDATGRELLAAVAAGYQVAVPLARAAGPRHYHHGFHSSGTCNGAGVAAAAASLYGLDEEATGHAIALAMEQASGLRQYQSDGGMGISAFHIAHATHAGVLAAALARRGYTAPRQGLEGRFGFFRVMAGQQEPPARLPDVGVAVMQTSLQLYPSCSFTHGAIDAARQAMAGLAAPPEAIRSIRVHTFRQVVEEFSRPVCRNETESTISTEYNVAVGLRFPVVLREHFDHPYVDDPALQDLVARVTVVESAELSGAYPREWGYVVEIVLRDGRSGTAKVRHPRGHPENPMEAAEIDAKYKALAEQVLGSQAARQLQAMVRNLEKVRARELGESLVAVRPPAAL